MRYTESREKSAEILRLVLPLMARQSTAFHPVSYTVWYEHVTGVNPALSQVLEARLAANIPLTEHDVWELYARHIAARDTQAFEQLQSEFRSLLDDTARNAVGANSEAVRFGNALEDGRRRLTQVDDAASVRDIADELIDDTQRIHMVTKDLSQRLESSKREVETLTERLEKAQAEALIDPLTGLKNRRGFEQVVDDLLRERKTLLGSALLVADLDRFKGINDTYGHVQGDRVIRSVARTLQNNVKGRDIAARLGGEEFVLLLPDTSLTGASVLAEQIRRSVAQTCLVGPDGKEDRGRVTISLGVAMATDGETLSQVIERADRAMYAAKQAGRDRVSLSNGPAGA